MKKSDITIAGKTVTLGYCYATEIAYKDIAGGDINDFILEVGQAIEAQKMPDIKKTIYLILAGIMAYYQSQNEEAPITDADLMNEATPLELGKALGSIVTLRSQFYGIPSGEPKEKKTKGKKGKNS